MGQRIAMKDQSGHTNVWIAPTSRRSSPVRISSAAVEDSPFFLPDGDLIFRAIEGGSNFIYRMKTDGTSRRKITSESTAEVNSVSPDGRWVVAGGMGTAQEPTRGMRAFALDAVRHLLPTELGHERKICVPLLPKSGRKLLRVARDAGLWVAQNSSHRDPAHRGLSGSESGHHDPMVCAVGRESFALRLH
jgi:hypothetical protein